LDFGSVLIAVVQGLSFLIHINNADGSKHKLDDYSTEMSFKGRISLSNESNKQSKA
jgi:hypothetical protein